MNNQPTPFEDTAIEFVLEEIKRKINLSSEAENLMEQALTLVGQVGHSFVGRVVQAMRERVNEDAA